ncbi:hypothetical protein U3A55_11800 [Salarchaeum sp. III]|uniref:hypothetical protein n=1 Tax=Salarchaeum sp. III TaxID=3107927 RepID=UPI002EDAEF4B
MTLSQAQWATVLDDATPPTYGEIVDVLESKDLIDEPAARLVDDALDDEVLVETDDGIFPELALAADSDEHTDETGAVASAVQPSESGNTTAPSQFDKSDSGSYTDADWTTPESNVWPQELLERTQWMGHADKKPFAPWADRNAPAPCSKDGHTNASECDCDARWKWSYTENYVDGETIAIAEDDHRLDGRAFLQQDDDPYVHVDGDDVRDPETGAVHPAFTAILTHLGATYTDISTSGAGVHANYQGDLPEGVKQATWELDTEPWGANDDLPEIEIYPGKRVCVMTGQHVPGTPTDIRPWNDAVLEPLLEATNNDTTPSTDRDDYDLADYEPTASTSEETTTDIRDIFAALDRLDARRVAENTIVHAWNDDANTTEGKRAFAPTWGRNANGTANIVDEDIWQDTGGGGYGGPTVMAAIDRGDIRPNQATGGVRGQDWFRAVDHLRDLGFPIPELVSTTPDSSPSASWGIEECTPPIRDAKPFDREQRWSELQGERFDDVLDHDGISLWGDEAGAGKTTNAGVAALERDQSHVIYFDKHEKAREFVTDSVIQDFEGDVFQDADYFHLKGGGQKRHGVCMDADHADEDCPEHGHPSNCPSMCPVYDLDPEHETRQAYDALVAEVGPNKAHQILGLHDEDDHQWHGEECPWQAQYQEAENHSYIVGVHPYVTQKSVRSTGLNIIDETPDLHSRETTASPTELTRIANTLDRISDLRPRDDPVTYTTASLARFSRDVVDIITDPENDHTLADLEPPEVIANAYETSSDVAGSYVEREPPETALELAEALATVKVAHGETILERMRDDTWEGTPISIDPLLSAAVTAGLDETPVMQAVALPPMLDGCPWCDADVYYDNGARACTDDDCDWHEEIHTLVQDDAEPARATTWLATDPTDAPTALQYRELPLTSDLPNPRDTLVLDATATPEKVAALWNIPREDVRVTGDDPLEIPSLHATQVLDGQYHAGTIRNSLEDDSTLANRIQSAIDTAADIHQTPLFVVKGDLIPAFDFPDHGEVLHYHATRGLNRNDCDAVMCIGAPHPDVEDLQRDAQLLAMDNGPRAGGSEHSTRRDAPNPPVYRQLHYQDDHGQGRAVPTKHYTGMVGTLFRESREKELVQALHRIRPLLADTQKHAYLLTNVPTSLPIDELATFEELADPLEAMLPVPENAITLLTAVHDVVQGDGPDGFRAQALVDIEDGEVSNKVDGYHRLAQLSGLDVSRRTVYNWVYALEDIGLLHPDRYEQHAGVSYAVDVATLKSALSVLSHNAGFKVAAARRFRQILAESTSGLDWLAWARDVFDLSGGDAPTHNDRDPGGTPP